MQNAHNHDETTSSPRRRLLNCWSILSYPANNPHLTIHALTGQVTQEADGFVPLMRITKTSPIVSCDGRVVTTASGSQYLLGTPSVSLPFELDVKSENVIPREYLNEWIDSSNWLAI